MTLGPDGTQLQLNARPRGPKIPLRAGKIAACGLGLDQGPQTDAVNVCLHRCLRVVTKSLGQVERGDGVLDDFSRWHTWALKQEPHPQEALVGHGTLEQQAVVAQPVTVVRGVDQDRVLVQTSLAQSDPDAANLMVDQGDHAVVIGDQVAHLFFALQRRARGLFAKLSQAFIGHLGRPFQAGSVPPWAPVQVQSAMTRQIHIIRVVQPTPRLGGVKRVVRIRKRRPQTEGLSARLLDMVDGPVADPRGVMPGDRQA